MFEYVSRSEYQPVRKYVESVIKKVQKEFRNRGILTFRFYLIGSAGKRHLITREVGGNKGFDLDYNFEIQKYNPKYHDPKTLKLLFMEAFNKYLNNGYDSCEDSTSVFTIKKIDQKQSKIIHSFDFAIVENVYDNEDRLRQRYIRSVKINDKINYQWCFRKLNKNYSELETLIKNNGLWCDLRDLYLVAKNKEPNKKSRIVYHQTLETIYKRHFQ